MKIININNTSPVKCSSIYSNDILKWASYFVLFDILFLPFFPFLIMPYSLPLVYFFLITGGVIYYDKYFQYYIIICVCVICSLSFSLLIDIQSEYLLENFKRAFQLILDFGYFFFFRWVSSVIKINFKPLLLLFVIYIIFLQLLFINDPTTLIALKEKFYTASLQSSENILFDFRFDYFFTDANTAGYFFLIIVFFMITNLRLNAFEWQLLILSTILICITTRSRGVLISALLSLVVFLMARKDNFSSFKRGLLLFLPVLLLCFYMIAYNSNYLDKWGVFIDTYDQRMDTTNIEDSRINKYIESSTYYIPNFFGRGYTLTMNGENFRPHSDHIRMLYSYGIIAYFAVILFLFNKVFTYKALFMIPALIAFSINSLIDDHKLLGIILVFLAFIISRQKSIISKNIDMKRKELYAATNFI